MSLPSPVPGITVREVLAYGGFAVVYRARQESVGREVALKVDNRLAHDERDRRRFLREAHAAGQLSDHPNVISVFDAGITPDGRPYLVMELCPAGSLADRIRKDGPLRPFEVREIGVKIADALETAHQAGVLHRDLKPANILVNRYGAPGLADFGMAASHDASRHQSATLEALTPAYAPPEVFRMERPTVAVDVYGLGATLYALLSGRPPRWPADGNPSIATIIGLQDEPILDLPGVPAALTAVLRKALSTEAADRHPSAAALRDALQGVALEAPTGMFGVIPADDGPGAGSSSAGGSRSAVSPVSGAAAAAEHPSFPDAPAYSSGSGTSGSGSAAAGHGSGGTEHGLSSGRGSTSSGLAAVSALSGSAKGGASSWGATQPAAASAPIRGAARVPVVSPSDPVRVPAQSGQTRIAPGSRTERWAAPPDLERNAPDARPRSIRKRYAVLAAVAAASLGVVVAAAANLPGGRGQEASVGQQSNGLPVGIGAGSPTASPSPQGVSPSPTRAEAPAQPPPVRTRPPSPTAPPFQGADPDTITGVGLGPFRVGEPAQPLLAAEVARRPDSDNPCRAAEQLIASDGKYRDKVTGRTLSAHIVDGRIAHVTAWSGRQQTGDGLRVGSTLDEIKSTAPNAEEFGGDDGSFLVADDGGALLFVVRSGGAAAIVAGPQTELTSIAEELSQDPNSIAPLC